MPSGRPVFNFWVKAWSTTTTKRDKLLFCLQNQLFFDVVVVIIVVVVAAFKLKSSLKFIRQHLEVAVSYHFFTWVHVVYFSDMDECVHTLEYLGCSPNSFCINFTGSFFCACKEGYLGDGRTCQSKFWVNLTGRLFWETSLWAPVWPNISNYKTDNSLV